MMNTIIFVLYLVINAVNPAVSSVQDALTEEMEIQRQLNPIKTIHTKYGDIVDCMDMNKQLVFHHPLLKNHKLQKKPSFRKPIEETGIKNLQDKHLFGLDKDQCPRGTVPIRRTINKDIIQEKILSNSSILVKEVPGLHIAEMAVSSKFGPYYGVRGINSIYNPKVSKDQMSLSHLWIQNDGNAKISLGWQVSPGLYGDDRTHLYASWTNDNYYKTGCYNYQCPGFVQIHRRIYLGAPFIHSSSYGGQIYDFIIAINQDPLTKNWWINVKNYDIGYFPAKLFSNMNLATKVGWGGRTLTPQGSLSPPMGSGHFPDLNYAHASFFREISFRNTSKRNSGPEHYQVEEYIDKPTCFGFRFYGDVRESLHHFLQFGGPGGNCGP
ncbi:uncharacterized protein LOC114195597 isoform X1 [Vigna unguiculata]|uniref:uncharacterized protein LOC114195597 isoform X1 n=1 Tax=Vigna unguiculata TaxID=3917 RepID=UPI001015F142|nr:uncharacterized protein LOC114195597 isoform X1 [Vigna unguiculata]